MARRFFEDIKANKNNKKDNPQKGAYSSGENFFRNFANKNNNKNKKEDVHVPLSAITEKRHFGISENDIAKPTGKRLFMWIIVVMVALAVFISIFSIFERATITITPRQEPGFIDGTFMAYKDGYDNKPSYEIMVLTAEKDIEVPSTEERMVERKASGQIVIYNAHSGASQRLIKNTRFEAPDGKIYRIKESVVVPGTTVEAGELIPGSVEVTVYADEPGEKYNKELTDFTIPGFKGDPRYDNFYARSKTTMTGGFSGLKKFASEIDIANARENLRSDLRAQMLNDSAAQKPNGFILYQDAIFITFDQDENVEEAGDDSTRVIEHGVLYAAIFDEKELSKFIAKQSIASYDGDAIYVPNISELDFAVTDKEDISVSKDQIEFKLSGNFVAVWDINKDTLKSSLAGIAKNTYRETLTAFPNIEKADASVRPFWKRKFPNDIEDIYVNTVIGI